MDVLLGAAHACVDRYLLAGKQLGQVHAAEVADTAGSHHAVHDALVEVQRVFGVEEAVTAAAVSLHADFVSLEVGLLDIDLHAVGECQLGCSVDAARLFGNDFSSLGCLFHQRFVGDFVFIRFHVPCLHLFQHGQHLFLGGVGHALFFGGGDEHHLVVFGNQLCLAHLVDDGNRDVGCQLVHGAVFKFDAGDRLCIEEVAYIFVHVVAALGLLAFGVG